MTSSTGTEPTAPVHKARLVPVIAVATNFLVAVMDRGPWPAFNGIAVVAYRDLTGRRRRG